jgi:hypothetical protein
MKLNSKQELQVMGAYLTLYDRFPDSEALGTYEDMKQDYARHRKQKRRFRVWDYTVRLPWTLYQEHRDRQAVYRTLLRYLKSHPDIILTCDIAENAHLLDPWLSRLSAR